jgi:hypothetical protein
VLRLGNTQKRELVERLHHPVPSQNLAEMLALADFVLWRAERQRVVLILLTWVRKWAHLCDQRRSEGEERHDGGAKGFEAKWLVPLFRRLLR